MRPRSNEKLTDPERIRFVASAFPVLQGLKQVPIGLFSLMVFVGHAGLWPWYESWQPISGLLFLSLAIAMERGLSVYYGRAYGRVEHPDDHGRRGLVILGVLALVGAFFLDVVVSPPVSVVGLVVAVWLWGAWLEARRFRAHYAATAALLTVVSLFPLAGVTTPEQHFDVVLPAAFGLAMVVNGLVDHLLLRRLLPPVARVERRAS